MARFVYLIVSHTAPGQVARLANAIRQCSPQSEIVVHHDSKSPDTVPCIEGVHQVPRPVAVEWGDFSQVAMFLHATHWIRNNLDFDWLILISGQDYPIQPLERFEARLAASEHDAFFRYFEADDPAHWPKNVGLHRYYYRYFRLFRFAHYYLLPGTIKRTLYATKLWFNRIQPLFRIQTSHGKIPTKLGVRRLSVPYNAHFKCYGGWDWFNLNWKSVERIHRAVEVNPKLIAHYRHAFISSESFVHTILVNDTEVKVFNDACRYVNWGAIRHAASPTIITIEDLDKVLKSGQPFGRKFDPAIDSAVLDAIDARLGVSARSNGDKQPMSV